MVQEHEDSIAISLIDNTVSLITHPVGRKRWFQTVREKAHDAGDWDAVFYRLSDFCMRDCGHSFPSECQEHIRRGWKQGCAGLVEHVPSILQDVVPQVQEAFHSVSNVSWSDISAYQGCLSAFVLQCRMSMS